MSMFSKNALPLKSAISALAIAAAITLPTHSFAAECFDRDTDDPKAGNATAVIGPAVDVSRLNASEAFRPDSGADMFTGDVVATGDDSHLQLKLCDWSTYTFSPNSESAISEFFVNEGAGRRRAVNFLRGGFRFASGRDTEPGSTEVELQDTGVTMGVRGTNVILVELDGFIYALLEGPIIDNSGLTPKGLVEFWTGGNRETIVARLKRSGWALRIGPDGVSRPFRADAALLRRIYDAFVPVVPEAGGSPLDYAGDPLEDSGQGAQEGDDDRQYADNRGDQDNEDTENRPEQPSQGGDDAVPPPQTTIPVGEILPLPDLDDFAAMQTGPDGHIFGIASAQLFSDSGAGSTLEGDGVALIQISVDWATRTIAPEALVSFIKLDFSVPDNTDLTFVDDPLFVPDPVRQAFFDAILSSSGVPFTGGQNDLAVFPTQLYTFTVRQGANDTVTADVDVDVTANDGQGVQYNAVASLMDAVFMPGDGALTYFDTDISDVVTPSELASNFSTSGTSILTGFSSEAYSTLGTPTLLNGVSVGQLEVNFDNGTVGGGSSFFAISAAADAATGGEGAAQFVYLDQPVAFTSGLFDLSIYLATALSSDPDVLQGQANINNSEGLAGNIAAILSDTTGNHLYGQVDLSPDFGIAPVSAISDLEALAVSLGAGSFNFASTMGFSTVQTAGGLFGFGTSSASIDINFANRTVGGGNSFVSVSINDSGAGIALNFTEALASTSFDDALGGAGAFGFDASDFTGSNIDTALFLIRDGTSGSGEAADIFVKFNDGAGGAGNTEIFGMQRNAGATPTPIP